MTGRPPIPRKHRRTQKIVVSVSPTEAKMLREWAKWLGKPMAMAMRDAALTHELEAREDMEAER